MVGIFVGKINKAVRQTNAEQFVNVTGCLVMNNTGPSVNKKNKTKISLFHQSELRYFLSSGDTCCSDPVAMVTRPGLTEMKHLVTVAQVSKRGEKKKN